MGKRILVTGGTGFIGRHLVAELRRRGHEVMPLARICRDGIEANVANLHKGGLRMIEKFRPDIVYHLAGVGLIEKNSSPTSLVMVNGLGTMIMLQTAVEVGAKTFVYTTTCYEGGASAIKPATAYAATKAAGRLFCLSQAQHFDKMVIARLFNIYGPGQTGQAFIPKLIRTKISGDLVKVEQVRRDYVYVSDAVDSLIVALEYTKTEVDIGSGIPLRPEDLARHVWRILPGPGVYELVPYSESEIPWLVASMGWRSSPVGNYAPQISLSDGLDEMVRYYG